MIIEIGPILFGAIMGLVAGYVLGLLFKPREERQG